MKGCDEEGRIEEYNGKRSGGDGGGEPSFYFPIVSPDLNWKKNLQKLFSLIYLIRRKDGFRQRPAGRWIIPRNAEG